MDWFQALVLAVIQGLTEFLPVSSSGHLVLPSALLGWPDQGLAFDVAVHVGSLLAVVLYFREELSRMLFSTVHAVLPGSPLDSAQRDDVRLAALVVLATVPAGLAGVLFDDFIEANLRGASVLAATTIGFGLLLGAADRFAGERRQLAKMGASVALVIGLAQALALIPGTSRSGITITAALFLGFSRSDAAHFSFLLSVPLIAAAGLLKGLELLSLGEAVDWGLIGLGVVASGLTAYACIHTFLSLVERIGMMPFVIYRLLLGTVLIVLLL